MDIERYIGHGPNAPAEDDEAPGGMVINPHSALGKELRKWEQHRTELVPRGTNPGNPYVFRPYPKMLYRAQRQLNGQFACMPQPPHPYAYDRPEQHQQAILAWESFCRSCYRVVDDESADRVAQGQGWRDTVAQAMTLHEEEEQAIGNAAAEAAHVAQRMTEKAREELRAADASTHQHVVDVRGAKRGAKAVTAIEEE